MTRIGEKWQRCKPRKLTPLVKARLAELKAESETMTATDTPQQWAFADHPESEHWSGPFATKREAISEALGHFGDPEDGFKPCVSSCRPVLPSDEVGDEDWTFICVGPIEVIDFS